VAIAVVACSFMGYIALGRFIAHQLILTCVVIAVTGLLYLAIRAMTRDSDEAGLPVGEMLEQRFGLQTTQRQTLARLTELALTLLLIMLAVPFILLQWGFSGPDIRDWFTSLFFGFEVGQFRISLANIVIGILLFVALVLVTRLVQRWIKDVMLVPARLDVGIANSIETVVGYIGIGIAGLIALSYAGFDVTNLALVAGALSVGIGFGLQSIVNNFVSGLILLFERPIKVGDWIVTGTDEGYVRKISVRSTEIETFDRANVIIPNADLITGRVKNWTLRDQIGRVRIPVGISYSADPEAARAIMLKVADANANVLKFPAPSAQFDSFGDSSVNLMLNAYVGDVTRGISVRTELAFGILKAFREAQIEIPFPQHDIRLRDLEPFRHALQAAMQERLRTSRAADETKS
jgi:small-conductance mechanosensitive channel